ncbi:MAG: hypothetical protein J6B92_08745 [Paraprevotella sp.]|nr:hypothetical protein [Paraprevotella sp.]
MSNLCVKRNTGLHNIAIYFPTYYQILHSRSIKNSKVEPVRPDRTPDFEVIAILSDNTFCKLKQTIYLCGAFNIQHTTMAIAIKPIPVLTGSAAKRFIEIAEANESKASATSVSQEMRDSIKKMMERSRHIVIKHPAQ